MDDRRHEGRGDLHGLLLSTSIHPDDGDLSRFLLALVNTLLSSFLRTAICRATVVFVCDQNSLAILTKAIALLSQVFSAPSIFVLSWFVSCRH